MKKLLSSKSFLTVMSILSILFGFAVLCGGALFLLHSAGLFSLPQSREEITVSGETNGEAVDLPVYTKAPSRAEPVSEYGTVPEELLSEMPFIDTYYLKIRVKAETSADLFESGMYEIWRRGDRYRLHRYHPTEGEIEYTVICNGTRVQITDFVHASITYREESGDSLAEFAPLPDFSKLFAEEHRILEYQEQDNKITLSYEYPSGLIDRAEISKLTGLPISYTRTRGKVTLCSVEVISADDSYMFIDDMFSFD